MRRVFVVDDHAVVRRGLRALVDDLAGLAFCGESSTPDVDAVREAAPALVIADLSFGGRIALGFVEEVAGGGIPVVVLSMHDERLYAERALAAGARGYVMKHAPSAHLEAAIQAALDGRVWLSEAMTQRLLLAHVNGTRPEARSPIERLSPRELEVFELIGRGLSTRESATRLCLSVKTIESHRANIKNKLMLLNGNELTRAAVSWVHLL